MSNVTLQIMNKKLDYISDIMATKADIARLEQKMENLDIGLERIILTLDKLITSLSQVKLKYTVTI